MNIKNKKKSIFILLIILFTTSLLMCLFWRLDSENRHIIWTYIRVPNVLKAIVAGTALSLAGMFLQAISKNPLADPYLTGLSSGAGLGIVFSVLCFNSINYSLFGFIGALITATLVILLSGFSKFSITKLILIGLSINIFASAIISFLILTHADKAYTLTLLMSGGFSNADISDKYLLSLFLLTVVICSFFVPKLNLMRLDSQLIFSSKNQLIKYNIIFVILSAFLTSLSVFTAGIIGFIGIIAPILSKIIMGNDYKVLFFTNILIGSTLLLVSNFFSNYLIYPLQIPLGIVVAFIGAPIFIFFLLKKGGIFND